MHYFSDDLTEVLLDDVLAGTMIEVTELENARRNRVVL